MQSTEFQPLYAQPFFYLLYIPFDFITHFLFIGQAILSIKKTFFFYWYFSMKENGERRYRIWRCKKMKVLAFSHSLKNSFSYTKREVCNFNFVEIVCLDLSKIPKFSLSWLKLNKLVSKVPSFNLKKILLGFALITYMSASLSILNWVSLVLSVYVCVCVVT